MWALPGSGRLSRMENAATSETLGDRLRKARVLADISASAMAAAMKVDRKTVWNWEHSKHAPNDAELRRWAEITGMPVAWLAGESTSDYFLRLVRGEVDLPDDIAAMPVGDYIRAVREGRGREFEESAARAAGLPGGDADQAKRGSPWIVSRSTVRDELLTAA